MSQLSMMIKYVLLLFNLYGLVSGKCNVGWQQYGDYCYIIITISSSTAISPNFNHSLSACNNILGNLPTFSTEKNWKDFISFAMENNITGVSALGYTRYNLSGNYTSMYDGHQPGVTNWGPEQPVSFYKFSVIRYSSNNFWETANRTMNPLQIVCQQGLVYSAINATYVSCTAVYRCYSSNLEHRFTTDPIYCTSGGLSMENPIRGYTSSIHIPSLTEPLYEMMNPYSGRLLMAYSNTIRDAAIRSFYNITNKVTYVFTVPFSSTVPYVLIWNYCKRIRPNDINSVLAPLNSSEYDILISSGWIEMASFYMFPNRSDSGFCSLYNGNNSVTSYVPSRSGIDSCNPTTRRSTMENVSIPRVHNNAMLVNALTLLIIVVF